MEGVGTETIIAFSLVASFRVRSQPSYNIILFHSCVVQVHYGEVDFVKFLPCFFEGLHEKRDPLKFLARQGTHELLEYIDSPTLIESLPAVMQQIYALFETNDMDVYCETLKSVQTLVLTHPTVGPELVRVCGPPSRARMMYVLSLYPFIFFIEREASQLL